MRRFLLCRIILFARVEKKFPSLEYIRNYRIQSDDVAETGFYSVHINTQVWMERGPIRKRTYRIYILFYQWMASATANGLYKFGRIKHVRRSMAELTGSPKWEDILRRFSLSLIRSVVLSHHAIHVSHIQLLITTVSLNTRNVCYSPIYWSCIHFFFRNNLLFNP